MGKLKKEDVTNIADEINHMMLDEFISFLIDNNYNYRTICLYINFKLDKNEEEYI